MASACSTTHVAISVRVAGNGQGTVAVVVAVPPATAARLPDLLHGLPVDDLRRAGWTVAGPVPGPAGSSLLRAAHGFTTFAEARVLVGDIMGSGPLAQRPLRLDLARRVSLFRTTYRASGVMQLRCGLACFDDPALAAATGYPLGLHPADVRSLRPTRSSPDLDFTLSVSLPGSPSRGDSRARTTFVWRAPLGGSVRAQASSFVLDTARLRTLVVDVCAGALVVLLTAAVLVLRHRRTRRRSRRSRPMRPLV